jgi:hypothetical protein
MFYQEKSGNPASHDPVSPVDLTKTNLAVLHLSGFCCVLMFINNNFNLLEMIPYDTFLKVLRKPWDRSYDFSA